MAKGKKTGGRDFKPGQSGNPRGGAAHNPALKVIRRMSHSDIAEIGQLILEGNLEKLAKIKEDINASVLKVWISSVAIKAINRGDAVALGVILDRIVGKVKDQVHITTDVEKMTDEQLIQRAKEISLILKDKE